MLANGDAIIDAVRRAGDFPGCSFGAHLNLTENRPLSNEKELAALLTPAGLFSKHAIRTTPLTSELRKAIYCELSAQVQFLLSQGVSISHFDSHHYIHTIPKLFGVLKSLQARFGVTKVRATMNVYAIHQSSILMLKKSLWNLSLRHLHKTTTTDLFTSLDIFHAQAQTMTRIPRSIELMTHPGSLNNDHEHELLSQGWENSCPFSMTPINYNQL